MEGMFRNIHVHVLARTRTSHVHFASMIIHEKQAKSGTEEPSKEKDRADVQCFIGKRDYAGAITSLEFGQASGNEEDEQSNLEWLGYCAVSPSCVLYACTGIL